MKTRLKARVGITYPVGDSVKVIAKAGGIRNLTPAQRAALTLKRVEKDGYCDDIPEIGPNGSNPKAAYLAAGRIEEVKVRKGKANG